MDYPDNTIGGRVTLDPYPDQDDERDNILDSIEQDAVKIIAQNCLALIIDRCEHIGQPLTDRRQRQTIKGAIMNMLEDCYLEGDLSLSKEFLMVADRAVDPQP